MQIASTPKTATPQASQGPAGTNAQPSEDSRFAKLLSARQAMAPAPAQPQVQAQARPSPKPAGPPVQLSDDHATAQTRGAETPDTTEADAPDEAAPTPPRPADARRTGTRNATRPVPLAREAGTKNAPAGDALAVTDGKSAKDEDTGKTARTEPGAGDWAAALRQPRLDQAAALAADESTPGKTLGIEAVEGERGVIEQRLERPGTEGAAAFQVLAAAPASSPDVAAPVTLSLPTPVNSPEFREALGVQVSVLAKDGVQRAELHLSPAEMGPISVQIALDGSKAQVDFGADSFATRQIIEAGLPELAAALREAGFTLTGGGVSQHAREQAQGDADGRAGTGGPGHRDAGLDGESGARRVVTRLPQGAVDLYA